MKTKLGQSLIESLQEVEEYTRGKRMPVGQVIISKPSNYTGKQVARIRKSLHLSQSVFAHLLGVSVKTVQACEIKGNTPSGPAQRILHCLKEDPTKVADFGLKIKR